MFDILFQKSADMLLWFLAGLSPVKDGFDRKARY